MSLEEALQAFQQEVELEMLSTTKDVVKSISLNVAQEMQKEYDYFFDELLTVIKGKLEYIPDYLQRYLPEGDWDFITSKWSKAKTKRIGMPFGNNWYYNGISNALTTSKGLSIRKNDGGVSRDDGRRSRSPKAKKTPSFESYISTLQDAGTTAKFFGPITLQYEFQSPAIGHKITPVMGARMVNGSMVDNVITRINRRTHKGTWGKVEGDLNVTAKVEAFGVLKDLKKLEWFIVDYIIKKIDPANEKQWVKINGTSGGKGKGKGSRPIRPLILPMIQFYINDELPKAMRKGASKNASA